MGLVPKKLRYGLYLLLLFYLHIYQLEGRYSRLHRFKTKVSKILRSAVGVDNSACHKRGYKGAGTALKIKD